MMLEVIFNFFWITPDSMAFKIKGQKRLQRPLKVSLVFRAQIAKTKFLGLI